jgi:hypothetical protein
MALFCAHKVDGARVPSYFIESTAPNNVDDSPAPPFPLPPQLQPLDADAAVAEIAKHLAEADQPNLVVLAHGFNNPEKAVLPFYAAASAAIEADPAICNRAGLVCVGYRWPSESFGQPLPGVWNALPLLPTALLWFGVALVLAPLAAFWFLGLSGAGSSIGLHIPILLGWALAGLILTAVLLRLLVYFRDNYRAQVYGVPDLVEIIRKIDAGIVECDRARNFTNRHAKRVQLSFICHSMGGFVVTNTIRILTDLFADAATRRPRLNDGVINQSTGWRRPRASSQMVNMGNAFRLTRFLLASPDIPAEALLSNRANFLEASLLRFEEAYLFSNEGDEVLRQVSTIANYFIFPTKTWKHGFRLGNVEILSEGYGVIRPTGEDLLSMLRVGVFTLRELYLRLVQARQEKADASGTVQKELAKIFSYFDCTDYTDCKQAGGPSVPLLSFALRTKQQDPRQGLSRLQHLTLLLGYARGKVDVHGGYFHGVFCQQLMYRLACLGYDATVQAYGGIDALSAHCNEKQIRALLSPELGRQRPPVP